MGFFFGFLLFPGLGSIYYVCGLFSCFALLPQVIRLLVFGIGMALAIDRYLDEWIYSRNHMVQIYLELILLVLQFLSHSPLDLLCCCLECIIGSCPVFRDDPIGDVSCLEIYGSLIGLLICPQYGSGSPAGFSSNHGMEAGPLLV